MVEYYSTQSKPSFEIRIIVAAILIGILFLVLIGRVIKLQVNDFDYFKTRSQNNYIQVVPTRPLRGKIFDRNNNLIAGHVTNYDLIYNPNISKFSKNQVIDLLGNTIGITEQEKRLIENSNIQNPNEGIILRRQLTKQEIANITSLEFLASGLDVKTRLYRYYPQKEILATISGYVGKISTEDQNRIIEANLKSKYRGIDIIGKLGLERYYEDYLRGAPGYKKIETTAFGKTIRTINELPPTPGYDLITSIDTELQAKIINLMGARNGAGVAIDPSNGEILALVSNQTYDPNIFVGESDQEIIKVLNDQNMPLLNRAIAGAYPPASTFKPFVGLAGLNYQRRELEEEYICNGYYSLPGSHHRYRDWNKSGHGKVNFHKSLVRSVDTYYYSLAVATGIENLQKYISKFNFGRTTGIDIVGEKSGLLPSSKWKKNKFRRDWSAGDTVSVGIGQGYMLSTPLQLAIGYSAIANRGYAYRPRIVKAVRNPLTGEINPTKQTKIIDLKIKPEYINAVISALADVNKPGGTSARAFSGAKYQSAGKTGTAQVISIAQDKVYRAKELKSKHLDHALYVGFAPVENPKIVMALILENAGGGSANAAPIVRKVFDEYLK